MSKTLLSNTKVFKKALEELLPFDNIKRFENVSEKNHIASKLIIIGRIAQEIKWLYPHITKGLYWQAVIEFAELNTYKPVTKIKAEPILSILEYIVQFQADYQLLEQVLMGEIELDFSDADTTPIQELDIPDNMKLVQSSAGYKTMEIKLPSFDEIETYKKQQKENKDIVSEVVAEMGPEAEDIANTQNIDLNDEDFEEDKAPEPTKKELKALEKENKKFEKTLEIKLKKVAKVKEKAAKIKSIEKNIKSIDKRIEENLDIQMAKDLSKSKTSSTKKDSLTKKPALPNTRSVVKKVATKPAVKKSSTSIKKQTSTIKKSVKK